MDVPSDLATDNYLSGLTMDFERPGFLRAATMESPEEYIVEVLAAKNTTIARNKAGRQAFMNNAPVDNFGTKEYQYVTRSTLKYTYCVSKTKDSKRMYPW